MGLLVSNKKPVPSGYAVTLSSSVSTIADISSYTLDDTNMLIGICGIERLATFWDE